MTSPPRRPIFTIIVMVAVTVLVTGILTGRIGPAAGDRGAAYGPATGDDTSPGGWTPAATNHLTGDAWDGNLVTDGSRVYLLSREDIQGFWGVLRLRWSDDAGVTWSDPVRVSSSETPDAARHTLAVEPDGTLWAAWAQRGPQEATQRLMLRRSRDRGLTWDEPTRVTGDAVGEVGVPALVMTPDQRFVAYTDGQTGAVYVQPLDAAGAATGRPRHLDATSRNLYTDEPFRDGGLAAAAIGSHAVIAVHGDDHIAIRATDDFVTMHGTAEIDDPLRAGPRLATAGGRVVSAVAISGGLRKGSVVVSASADQGATWAEVGRWDGPGVGEMSIAASAPETVVVWEACEPGCNVTQLRIADAAGLATGGRLIDRTDRSHPIGAVLVGTTLVVAWVREGPTGHAWERVLTVASGPLP